MKAIGWLGLALIAMALFSAFVVQSMVAMNRPRPAAELRRNAIMDVPVLTAREMSGIPKVENFEARDRSLIGYRHYQSKQASRVKLYLVHAETGDDLQLAALAGGVSSRLGLADVFTLDLRGHGQNPLHRGDIGYVGQPTNDLADLVAATSAPGDLVVVGGHSSGAAVAARLAAQPGRIKLAACCCSHRSSRPTSLPTNRKWPNGPFPCRGGPPRSSCKMRWVPTGRIKKSPCNTPFPKMSGTGLSAML